MQTPGWPAGDVDSDRNLLFAVLALQADLIDQDRFVQACTLWASRKDTPLAAVLVEQGWLSLEDCADVERLLARSTRIFCTSVSRRRHPSSRKPPLFRPRLGSTAFGRKLKTARHVPCAPST